MVINETASKHVISAKMIGPETIFSSFLARLLAALVEVDPAEIEMKLFVPEGKRVVLPNARLRPRRILVTSNGGISTFLVVSGSIQEFSICWSWSSSLRKLEETIISAQGIRIEGHFDFEINEHKGKTNKDSAAEPPKTKFLQGIIQDAIQRIQDSEKFQHILSNLLDTICIRLTDCQLRFFLPDVGDDRPSKRTELVVFFKSLLLESQGTGDHGASTVFVSRPLTVEAGIHALSINAIVGEESVPVLEPFTYIVTIRKVFGLNVKTVESGYEIIGRERHSRDGAIADQSHDGIVCHLSTITISVISQVVFLFKSHVEVDPETTKEYSLRKGVTLPHTMESGGDTGQVTSKLIFATLIFMILGIMWWLFTLLDNRIVILFAEAALGFTVLGAGILLYIMKRVLVSSKHVHETEPRRNDIAIFRIPVPFISLVCPKGLSASLSKVSLLGRLDMSVATIAADSLSCRGGEQDDVPARVSATGIRFSLKRECLLLNIDSISELFYPRVIDLCRPIKCTTVKFQNGVLTTKLNLVDIQMVPQTSSQNKEHAQDAFHEVGQRVGSVIGETRRIIGDTGQKITGIHRRVLSGMQTISGSKELSSNPVDIDDTERSNEKYLMRLHSDLATRIASLKTVAVMLDAMPLSKNRYRLRLYHHSFRGNEAVDYLLHCRVARNRIDATKLLRDLQIQFRLFEHVTREYNFRDEHDSIFRFVDEKGRRMWNTAAVPFKYTEIEEPDRAPSILPFPVAIFVQELTLRKPSETEAFICVGRVEIYGEPSNLCPACDVNIFVATLETKMISASNARARGLFDPDVPQAIHGLELSADSVHASPGHTTEDWYEWFNLTKEAPQASETSAKKQDSTPFFLPHMYIAPFMFRLSWRGVVFATKETSIAIEAFTGDEKATSNDLINYFVMQVLSCAPGLVANFRVFGVNVVEKSGIVSAMTVGAKIVPFGEYLSIGGIALMDGVTLVMDRGRAARDDTNGNHRVGDFFRGIKISAEEAAMSGARTRGKIDEEYCEEDEIKLDPLDFAVGVTGDTANYIYSNKGRFAAAAVAGASVVALTVATGPIAGIVLGVACGIVAETVVKAAEKKFERAAEDSVTYDEPNA